MLEFDKAQTPVKRSGLFYIVVSFDELTWILRTTEHAKEEIQGPLR